MIALPDPIFPTDVDIYCGFNIHGGIFKEMTPACRKCLMCLLLLKERNTLLLILEGGPKVGIQ